MPASGSTALHAQDHGHSSWSLLERFYQRAGAPAPDATEIAGPAVPEPYRRLLVHSRDMTPTLETFHACKLMITVLSRHRDGETYLREVLLRPSPERPAVEYGVIRIFLDRLPISARFAVLAEERPFGDILQTELVAHLSWPQAFFCIQADRHLSRVLGLSLPGPLYGRRNVLVDGDRQLLAEVIEVLPPTETRA